MAFKLFSEDFKDGDTLPEAQVFNGMGYRGGNVSPQLRWDDVPAGTRSFVVTLYDPDAPTGSGWWHWVVANLPAACRVLPRGCGSGQGGLPRGAVQTRTDFGSSGYGGAAPARSAASLHLHRARAEGRPDRRQREQQRGDGGIHGAHAQPGQRLADGALRPLSAEASGP